MVIAHKCSYIMQWMFMNVSIALLWSSSPPEQGRRGTWVRSVIQGDCFDWSRPKSFKYGTGPAQKRKIINMAKISTKKVKVEVKASQSFPFCCNFNSRKTKVWQALTWTFTFLVEIFLSSMNLFIFLLLGGTSSILRTFLGGTSQKNHPVCMYLLRQSHTVPQENTLHAQRHIQYENQKVSVSDKRTPRCPIRVADVQVAGVLQPRNRW